MPHSSLRVPISLGTLFLLVLSGCTPITPAGDTHNSANQNSRVSMVIIHHTTVDYQESLDILTLPSDRPVSAHYLIPEPSDPSYPKAQMRVQQLVPESQRAWHAGRSYWAGKTGLNDQSIGIELVNLSYCHVEKKDTTENKDTGSGKLEHDPEQICFFPDFAEHQITLLIDLLKAIVERHPDIRATNIIGHSDIAPARKSDPGPRFPWQQLYKQGYGAWYDDKTVVSYWQKFQNKTLSPETLQQALKTYGYGIEVTGVLDRQTREVVRAFQLHFVPDRVTGVADAEFTATLFALVDKYHPDEVDNLFSQALIVKAHDE